MRLIASLLVVCSVLALAGCGRGGGSQKLQGTYVEGYHVSGVFKVHETEYALRPSFIHVIRFGYYGIKAINDGNLAHALAIEGHGLHKRTEEIQPGQSATMLVLFLKAGRYELYCPIDGHADKGMKGTVKVH